MIKTEKIKDRFGNDFYIRNDVDKNVANEIKGYHKQITTDEDDIWLDIGSHIGLFTLSIYDKVKEVICFEPSIDNFRLLKKHLEINNVTNVKCFNRAVVGNDDVQRLFYLNTLKNTGGHSFYIKRGRKEITVDCANINDIFRRFEINKIKMDCEGAEYEILKRINKENYAKIQEIIFEYHFNALKDHPEHKKYEEIIKILKIHFSHVDYLEDVKRHWHTVVFARK